MVVEVWFGDIGFDKGSVTDFVYTLKGTSGFEENGEKRYVRCELSEVFESEEFRGVVLVYEED